MNRKARGLTLLEMVIVIGIILVLAKITVPRFVNIVGDINLRYVANNYSGLLQSARIMSVRKNAYYGINTTTMATGGTAFYVDFHGGSYATGDPMLPLGSQVTVHAGTGSGAPNEAALTCGTGCSFASSSSFPYFNARGLPCQAAAGVCLQNNGIVTAGGRIQIWTSDGGGFTRRDVLTQPN